MPKGMGRPIRGMVDRAWRMDEAAIPPYRSIITFMTLSALWLMK